ncbi:MAG: Asp-tRNA(Asn)/Glu-tRNA(Gln) amidotransferase subunit GatC [Clostridiales bacterium]|nr:Asp-tRNA(Asn)/Glu-tRNA(Gln) amidotransferase subunit GatC [Clostridiales bacterium]
MDKETLRRLELLNQLRLTEEEKASFMKFFDERYEDACSLDSIDTSAVERMVHVMPVMTVVREDVVKQNFAREDLQKSAPETDEGYWCVPRVVE